MTERILTFADVRKINPRKKCREAIIVALENESTREPRPDVPATIQCRIKIKEGKPIGNDICTMADSSECPLGLSF